MASLSTKSPERRSSSFLKDTKVDEEDKSEWASMSNNTIKYNDSKASEEEISNINTMRTNLGSVMTEGPLSKQPENVSDYKLLRFLRGYETIEEAETAFREMAEYRDANGFNEIRQKLVDRSKIDPTSGKISFNDPNYWEEYQPIRDVIAKGIRYEYGIDNNNNVMTVTDIGALDIRAIIKHGLQDLWSEMCLTTEEYSNLKLHDLTVERGHLVARHDVINVSNFGLFQWNKECYSLITKVFAGNTHYPESVVKITSCGNGSVAVMAWKVMKHFVPERTKRKLSVLGTTFIPDLIDEVPFHHLPLTWGGGSSSKKNGFDQAWSEECSNISVCVGRRDVHRITIGCEKKGQIVQWSWKILGYSIKVSTQFARLEEIQSDEKEEKVEGETKSSPSPTSSLLKLQTLPLMNCGQKETTIESSEGLQSGEFVAPCRGAFVYTFDNTFSYLRSKTINNLSIQVIDGNEKEEDDEDEGEMTL